MSPCYSGVEVYHRVCQYAVTSPLGAVTRALEQRESRHLLSHQWNISLLSIGRL